MIFYIYHVMYHFKIMHLSYQYVTMHFNFYYIILIYHLDCNLTNFLPFRHRIIKMGQLMDIILNIPNYNNSIIMDNIHYMLYYLNRLLLMGLLMILEEYYMLRMMMRSV
jgi:hypothetical protein